MRAAPDCVSQLITSVSALFSEDGGQRDPHMDIEWPEREGAGYYASVVENPRYLCLLAYQGTSRRSPVGHLVGRLSSRNALRPRAVQVALESMRVHPTYRNDGVGTLLVRHFLEWARSQGANEASVTAYSTNTSAIEFYCDRGFTPFELTLHMAL